MLALFALLLAFLSLGVAAHLSGRLHRLEARLARLDAPAPPLVRPAPPRPLAGVRVGLDLRQDHPHSTFSDLLRKGLEKEDALVENLHPDVRIVGEIVGNGYTDVYFRAEVEARFGSEVLFVLQERPPHGDRPENLAGEIVARLATEWVRRERQDAVRELHGEER